MEINPANIKKRRPYSGLVIAGTSSSAGKTLVTLGLMQALRLRGLTVAPFKAGPDYIDSGLHAAVLKRPSYNLDTWMMGTRGVKHTYDKASSGADIAIVEGVMGLYDGSSGKSGLGSTAHLAKTLGLPVLLVVDAARTARSAGAIITGFKEYDKKADIRWVVFNRVGSERHFQILKDSIPQRLNIRCLGYLPRDPSLAMPERHLGLVNANDIGKRQWRSFLKKAAQRIEGSIGIDGLLAGLEKPHKANSVSTRPDKSHLTIAVARDAAFSFYYEENLELLRRHGARIRFFSPLIDRRLPEGTSGIYIGGGYPELHAARLEANVYMRRAIKTASRKGLPVFAECGGLIYLGASLVDREGRRSAMAGVFAWHTRMLARRAELGYREVEVAPCPVMPEGGRIRGHEFHYSTMNQSKSASSAAAVFTLTDNRQEGFIFKNCLATYVHLHFASNPAFAKGFVRLCEEYQKENSK